MSEVIPYADIVIIALIAGFILLRLRSVLGDKTGHDNPQFFIRQMDKPQEKKERIIGPQEKTPQARPKKEDDADLEKITNEKLKQTLKDIKEKDTYFTVSKFLEGAKLAFEMVFDAFTKGDRDTLRMLLADNIYRDFVSEIERRDKAENKTETTLVAMLSKEIKDAVLIGRQARITVKFVSEQVTVLRNSQGEIIEGDASQTEHVENEWVFERDTSSKNPNWKIIET